MRFDGEKIIRRLDIIQPRDTPDFTCKIDHLPPIADVFDHGIRVRNIELIVRNTLQSTPVSLHVGKHGFMFFGRIFRRGNIHEGYMNVSPVEILHRNNIPVLSGSPYIDNVDLLPSRINLLDQINDFSAPFPAQTKSQGPYSGMVDFSFSGGRFGRHRNSFSCIENLPSIILSGAGLYYQFRKTIAQPLKKTAAPANTCMYFSRHPSCIFLIPNVTINTTAIIVAIVATEKTTATTAAPR